MQPLSGASLTLLIRHVTEGGRRQAFNPKGASVYLALVPQFGTAERSVSGQIAVLATVHALLLAGWLAAWTVLVRRAARTLRRPRFKQAVNRIAAAVLVGLGVRAAVT